MIRRAATALALCAALLVAGAAPASAKVPRLKHVFIVVLENENFETTFGHDSAAPYLARTLRKRGAFLPNYYAIGHLSLDNYIAMISGQAPNPSTQSDCLFFTEFEGTDWAADGQLMASTPLAGCVYPPGVATIANQLEDSGYSWKGYMEDINAAAPPGEETPCRHPDINAEDDTQNAEKGDQYAARHNPFVYFHSIIDFPTCAKNDVDFTHLRGDLKHRSTTPNYAFITPNLCHDGHDEPCVDGQPGGLTSANKWLRRKVPRIRRSPAFRHRGLLIVTFDEAESGPGGDADASACCDEQPGPNTPNPGGPTVGPGGGRTGAVLLSPCIRPRTRDETPYNHYSLLKSIEKNFRLPYLGFAGQDGLKPLGRKTLNRRRCGLR